MADKVVGQVRWPVMPEGIDPVVKQYLLDMQKAVSTFLEGQVVCLSGDLFVGGSVYHHGLHEEEISSTGVQTFDGV